MAKPILDDPCVIYYYACLPLKKGEQDVFSAKNLFGSDKITVDNLNNIRKLVVTIVAVLFAASATVFVCGVLL